VSVQEVQHRTLGILVLILHVRAHAPNRERLNVATRVARKCLIATALVQSLLLK